VKQGGIKEELLFRLIPAETLGAFDGEDGDTATVQNIINPDQVDRPGDEEHYLPQIDVQSHAFSPCFRSDNLLMPRLKVASLEIYLNAAQRQLPASKIPALCGVPPTNDLIYLIDTILIDH
jgi:hypothetical protein